MKITPKTLILPTILSIVAAYLCNRIWEAVQIAPRSGIIPSVEDMGSALLSLIASAPFRVSLDEAGLTALVFGFAGVWLAFLVRMAGKPYRRPGEEHGSSRWGTKADIKPFINPNPDMNIILSQTEGMNIEEFVKDPKYSRNKNVVIIGGSGTGKTRFFVYPNLLQLHSSYVVTDPKGDIYDKVRPMFERNGYKIRCFNTVDMSRSCHFNPLAYITNESDILEIVNVIIENTKGKGEKSGEDFWVKAERLLYNALIGYLFDWYGFEGAAQNPNISLPKMQELLLLGSASEEDEGYVSELDELFAMLEERRGECFSTRQYKAFKQAAGKTMKSVLISCSARLAPFDIPEVSELLSYDEVGIYEIGTEKTAFFMITSDNTSTYDFLGAMIFSLMFTKMFEQAYKDHGGRLPVHVRFILDEFANMGVIPDADKKLSVMRSRNMSASIVLQSISQLEKNYKETKETLIDNCDSLLFLGSKSNKTNKEIAEQIGKATVHNTAVTESKGASGSYSEADQILGRYLIDPAEIGRLERDECLVLITGVAPFKSKKYDVTKHSRWSELAG